MFIHVPCGCMFAGKHACMRTRARVQEEKVEEVVNEDLDLLANERAVCY